MLSQPVRDFAAEMLTAIESPWEPMLSYLRIDLKFEIDPQQLHSAVILILQGNEKLKQGFKIQDRRLHWFSLDKSDSLLADEILSPKNQSETDFWNQSLSISSTPGWRLKIVSARSLYLSIHHGITDGTGALRLISSLVEALNLVRQGDEAPKPLQLNSYEKKGKEFVFGLKAKAIVYKEMLKKIILAKLYPPMMVGPLKLDHKVSQKQIFASLDEIEFRKLRNHLLESPHVRNLTDVFLMALHLSLSEWNQKNQSQSKGGNNRISVMVPFDLRSYLRIPEPLWNCVGTLIVQSWGKDRRNLSLLRTRIQQQTRKFEKERSLSSSFSLLRYFSQQLDQGEILSDSDWRFDSTACLSHIPLIPVSKEAMPFVEAIYGAPPVKIPTGVSIGAGAFDKKLFLCLRYSEAAMDEAQAKTFFESWLDQVHKIAQWR